jgi:pyridoxal phosphate enzyme (YggS family)
MKKVLAEIPADVSLVVVAKGRQPAEVVEAISEGALIIGENYVQEAEEAQKQVGRRQIQWHFIGHLQSNKARKAVGMFDMIQTVDSVQMAEEIDRLCAQAGKVLPVLIEVNSGREPQKSGLMPEAVEAGVADISALLNIRILGLMTMGPSRPDAVGLAPYFKQTRRLFESLGRAATPHVEMKYLSMGMSDSYKVAIAEGATMVRLGRAIFGER